MYSPNRRGRSPKAPVAAGGPVIAVSVTAAGPVIGPGLGITPEVGELVGRGVGEAAAVAPPVGVPVGPPKPVGAAVGLLPEGAVLKGDASVGGPAGVGDSSI